MRKVVFEWGRNYEIVCEGLPPMLCLTVATTKYINGIYQTQKLKKLFMRIQEDNERMINSPEYKVLYNCATRGSIFAKYFMIFVVISMMIYLLLPTATNIYNQMHPVNGTVKRELLYPMDMNLDPDKYFYLITICSYWGSIVFTALICALDTMYITLMQHACGLFETTGFRLKTAHILSTTDSAAGEDFGNIRNNDYTPEEQNQMHRKLVLSIKEHKNALQYMELFQPIFSVALFVQLCLIILSLSITLLLPLMKIGNLYSFMRMFILTVGQLFHLFWLCLPGQNLMDYSEQLYCDSLECMWYTMSKESNVLYQFLLMNTLKSCKLVAFKLAPLNMETYLSTAGLYSVWGVNYDAVIESLSPMISVLFSTAMYLNGIFNMHKVKEILLFIKNDTNYYMNRPENVILRHYQIKGRKVVIYYASYVYVTLLAYLAAPGIPLLIDLVSSSNYSHGKTFLYEVDYGVDKEKYYYYISLHSYTATTVVANLIATCDTTYMFYAHHAYALFAIVNYQLKTVHIADTSKLIDVKDSRLLEEYANVKLLPREREKIYNKLLDCIKGHQNAIKYTNLIESLFSKSLLVQLFLNVLGLTITGVETVMKMDNIGDLMRFGTFTLSQTVHIFFLCLPGQKLVNHSEQMYTAACEVMWYVLPKKCHNLYILLLTKALTPSKITAYNMASMTMETFLSIIQTAMSYFTVLLSTT